MQGTDKPPRVQPRQDRKLERLARIHRSAAELADQVANTATDTAQLFASEYKPSSEWGEDPRQD
jgi:hypothetical protein